MTDMPPRIQEVTASEDHLAVLSIYYYIFGGIQIAFALLLSLPCIILGPPLIQIWSVIGGADAPRRLPLLASVPAVLFGSLVLLGTVHVYSGLCIKRHEKRFFSLVLAGFDCLLVPLGTVLGIAALIILNRVSVKRMYEV